MKLYYGQDNEDIIKGLESKFEFDFGDIRYVKHEHRIVYDFVGFVLSSNEALVVFPKHYFSINELNNLNFKQNIEDSELLFKVIGKYLDDYFHSPEANKYFGSEIDYCSDYPFKYFYEVYDYYKKYGIYHEDEIFIEKGIKGKISWKNTIQRSNVLVADENLIFYPLFSKKNRNKDVFLSDCMIFVINHTIESFPFLLDMPLIPSKINYLNFLANKTSVINKLYQYKTRVFKDSHKKLINSLINFFESFDSKMEGGKQHLKITYFDRIWEAMVDKYLRDCFVKVDEEKGILLFDSSQRKSNVTFLRKKFDIDNSSNKFSIIPDHYGTDGNNQFIFDSKYYYEISDLNYKQFAYSILIAANVDSSIKTYSALLLPGFGENKLHFDAKQEFRFTTSESTYQIIEQYLNVKEIMKHYINN